jgi:hypothetical protein
MRSTVKGIVKYAPIAIFGMMAFAPGMVSTAVASPGEEEELTAQAEELTAQAGGGKVLPPTSKEDQDGPDAANAKQSYNPYLDPGIDLTYSGARPQIHVPRN